MNRCPAPLRWTCLKCNCSCVYKTPPPNRPCVERRQRLFVSMCACNPTDRPAYHPSIHLRYHLASGSGLLVLLLFHAAADVANLYVKSADRCVINAMSNTVGHQSYTLATYVNIRKPSRIISNVPALPLMLLGFSSHRESLIACQHCKLPYPK